MTIKEITDLMLQMNVNDMTEEKNGLTYLSWASAWGEVLKVDPEANYKVKLFDGLPFCGNNKIGYMVFTELTINGLTRECYLPVMDSNNKSMKDEAYTITKKYFDNNGIERTTEKTVEAMTSFDVNKTIQRCLAKNIAMFGLGLYIYKGEDLPESAPKANDKITELQKDTIFSLNCNIPNVCKYYNVETIDELTSAQASEVIRRKRAQK